MARSKIIRRVTPRVHLAGLYPQPQLGRAQKLYVVRDSHGRPVTAGRTKREALHSYKGAIFAHRGKTEKLRKSSLWRYLHARGWSCEREHISSKVAP